MDRDALLRQAKRLLEEQPRTRSELGKLLAERWSDADPSALAYAATHHIALCQVPPRGIWGKNGPAAWAPVESWLGAPLRPVPVDSLVLLRSHQAQLRRTEGRAQGRTHHRT